MATLVCRDCGRSQVLGVYPKGCPACARDGKHGVLEATYEYDGAARTEMRRAFDSRRVHSVWRFDALLPLTAREAHAVTLGEGGTPLVEAGWINAFASLEAVFLKNETANPTWCSKDRGNAVSVSVGRKFQARGMVAVTTGNHGASAAAYCGHAGVPCIVLMAIESDVIHRAMVAAYGGVGIVSAHREAMLHYLVQECGWFPVTSMGDTDAPNPFGAEAYKTIAYEVFEDLGGMPDAILMPAASGDLLYGVYKGFRELQELGFARTSPRIIGCQADGAAPLARALQDHLNDVPVLSQPKTVAISIGDATGGKAALEAVRASGGDIVTVTDEEILLAQHHLASHGVLVETASASSVAGAAAGHRAGVIRSRDKIVCVVTGSGAKWSTQLLSQTGARVHLEPSQATIRDLVHQLQETPRPG
jgi:threonine synthase